MSIAFRLVLHLPRDAATVPVARRLLGQALGTLGVEDGCRDDISLILTEACANVIEHALDTDDYEITIDVTGARCVIHVVNAGAAVDPADLTGDGVASLDEHGRGLQIIRSLADELYLTPALSGGLVLQAVTTLRWTAGAPAFR
ncbi:ATP-binding protein [Dactylosporangium sp. NPDC051541]|uniref:ATP-binding protein n=1 Tax=Dactylosporangium sp. NPDC051541 TaxID=3363977 RepID=UPI0037B1387A